ncbi:MAG: protein kinase, partial [Verrucomicrobia bacterium]|nr:protein kinase [Verrucomicrobiota bacterium]
MKLGQGGMGAVYLARQKTLRRFCAVKVISPQFAQDRDSAERFLREARATAALAHPNLVAVFDCDQFDGQYFIAMEYVEGMSLGEILKNYGPLPVPLALFWLNQAAVGLEYIHGEKIIHRDIKPDNMIVNGAGVLKIMDLGLAKAKDHFETDHGMTMTGTVMGSPHYMSPEQVNDSKTADHRSDLYSLGISFYQMVTGRVPFQKTSAAAVCVAHLHEPIPSVGPVLSGLSRAESRGVEGLPDAELTQALDALILKMAAKDKAERFQSASEWVAALAPWIAHYPMDEPAQEFFGKIEFAQRKVAALLEKEGIHPAEVDAEIPSPVAKAMEDRSPVAKAPAQWPVAVAADKPTRKPMVWAWAVGLLVVLLGLAGWYFGVHHPAEKARLEKVAEVEKLKQKGERVGAAASGDREEKSRLVATAPKAADEAEQLRTEKEKSKQTQLEAEKKALTLALEAAFGFKKDGDWAHVVASLEKPLKAPGAADHPNREAAEALLSQAQAEIKKRDEAASATVGQRSSPPIAQDGGQDGRPTCEYNPMKPTSESLSSDE